MPKRARVRPAPAVRLGLGRAPAGQQPEGSPGPDLQPGHAEAGTGRLRAVLDIDVRPLQIGDIPDVARVHIASFQNTFLSSLGPGFLRQYYRTYLEYPQGCGLVAVERSTGNLAGFVCGTENVKLHYRVFLLYHLLQVLAYLVTAPLHGYRYVLGVIHRAGRVSKLASFDQKSQEIPARLMSVGVDPRFQRRGIGEALVTAFTDEMRGRGLVRLRLGVRDDNAVARRLYERLGWYPARSENSRDGSLGWQYVIEMSEAPDMGRQEQLRIGRVYEFYDVDDTEQKKRDRTNLGNSVLARERHRAFSESLGDDTARIRDLWVLDVGCGTGELLGWLNIQGVPARQLHGIDLLYRRVAAARAIHPKLNFERANAASMPFGDASFDLVVCATLFSSILDPDVTTAVADEVRRVLRPGGRILWYDTRYPNPWNPNTHPVSRARIRQLFPNFTVSLRTITLLPPLARRLGSLAPTVYPVLAALPPLRTHQIGVMIKRR